MLASEQEACLAGPRRPGTPTPANPETNEQNGSHRPLQKSGDTDDKFHFLHSIKKTPSEGPLLGPAKGLYK